MGATIVIESVPDPEFIRILTLAVQDPYICDINSGEYDQIEEEVESFIESAHRTNAVFLKVKVGDRVVGIAMPRRVPPVLIAEYRKVQPLPDNTGHPWIVYILPTERKCGYARLIIDYCKQTYESVLWFPNCNNHKSIQLAQSNGFRPINSTYSTAYLWSPT